MKIIDFHCDTILGLMEQGSEVNLRENNLCVDIQKLHQGKAVAQFFALFIDLAEGNPLQKALQMADRFYRELEKNADAIKLAVNYQDYQANEAAGRISAFLTIEEGGVFQGEIANLRNFYRLGVRLVTLSWNYPNELGFPNHEGKYSAKGLTVFGREVVTEMNRLGMIIDVSHLSDQGFYDVAALSTQPFVASHSNARSVKGHLRNLTDEMIKILAEHGGITGINFSHNFLGDSDYSRIEDMVAHIKHIRQIGGIDVVALGTDFDGIESVVEISHIGEMDKLVQRLYQESFTESEIEKICYKNALRVIKEVL
ncbi:MAG: dipeptidase [Pelosinus sp.]|nr:dipeptidase [Pelosinus sp.]